MQVLDPIVNCLYIYLIGQGALKEGNKMKTITCKKCGIENLVWVFSAKGKWYLSEPSAISTTFGGNKTIPFGHKCRVPKPGDYDYREAN